MPVSIYRSVYQLIGYGSEEVERLRWEFIVVVTSIVSHTSGWRGNSMMQMSVSKPGDRQL